MKKLLQLKLKIFARAIVEKYNPQIVGITGSIGKTSAKEAVYAVLSTKFRVRRNIKNYNNEIGLPLSIIGVESPRRALFGWLKVFGQSLNLILSKDENFPEILILEMGVDKPKDMDYLLNIARPTIGLLTYVGTSHIEYFESVENIRKEKGKLIAAVPADGFAIINYDNEEARKTIEWNSGKLITYGFDERAKVRASEIFSSYKDEGNTVDQLAGITFKLIYEGSFVPVHLSGVIGRTAIYAALAGAAAGLAMKMNLIEISQALKSYKAAKGRMNLIKGIKNTMIVDDTYNASPQSMIAALDCVSELKTKAGGRKIAILGDMLELGNLSESGHEEVGRALVKAGFNLLITVGERSRGMARGAIKSKMSQDDIFHFSGPEEAARFTQDRTMQGDLILIKGSQGMRMEKAVLELMAEPQRAEELLVRQDAGWK